jgi:hypothetical protein
VKQYFYCPSFDYRVLHTDPWAKGGVMIRASLAANSQNAMALISSSNGAAFQRRTVSGGSTSSTVVSTIAAPRWVRVVRSSNTFTGYYSSNGTTIIPMGSTVYLGLAVTSHVSGTLGTGTLDGVTVSPVDLTSPTVNLTTANSPVSGPFDITVAFSEAITDLSLTDFAVTNGSASALDGADSTYTLTVAPTTSGKVSTSVPAGVTMDAASNSNFDSNILDVVYTP